MKSLYESILSKSNVGIDERIKQILSTGTPTWDICQKLTELWNARGLDLKGHKWVSYIDKRGFSYVDEKNVQRPIINYTDEFVEIKEKVNVYWKAKVIQYLNLQFYINQPDIKMGKYKVKK